jgi:hypothetical protein
MLLNGYICNDRNRTVRMKPIRHYKEATNQSLNQKSRCFYIGAFLFCAVHVVQFLQVPLTTISTCVVTKPLGNLIDGIDTSSRHTVLPQVRQTKCT